MTPALCIARHEWRRLRRDRVALLGLAGVLLLWALAAFTAWDHRSAVDAERGRRQAEADHAFEAQPDRHPHRMVHYGHFVFRPLPALAAFDPGVDAYTGHTLFVEGHRQNSANFGDVRQSSLLLRFGQWTPAFVLQVLAPLLLVFVGHGVLARERESGTLRVLLAQGVRARDIVAGKLLGLGGIAALILAPALLGLAAIGAASDTPAARVLALAGAYGLWLLLWVLAIVAVSALFTRSHAALVALLAAWAVGVVVLPRIAAELVSSALPLPTRFETDIVVARELAALGDSHDPDDPYFNDFRRRVLREHGVSRVEDLPLNYKGLLGMEGERLTSALFERHAESAFERQAAQARSVDRWAALSPVIALRRLSTAAAGTDLVSYRRFLTQAEQHRYGLVQALNRLQAEKLSYAGDRSSRESRIARTHWHGIAEFRFRPEPAHEAARRAAPAALVLLLWAAGLAALAAWATRHVEGTTR